MNMCEMQSREPSPSAGVIDSRSVNTTERGGPRSDRRPHPLGRERQRSRSSQWGHHPHRRSVCRRLQDLRARPRRRGLPNDQGERSVIATNVLDRRGMALCRRRDRSVLQGDGWLVDEPVGQLLGQCRDGELLLLAQDRADRAESLSLAQPR